MQACDPLTEHMCEQLSNPASAAGVQGVVEQIGIVTQNHLRQCNVLAQHTDAVHAAQRHAMQFAPAKVTRLDSDTSFAHDYSNATYVCTIALLPQRGIRVPGSHAANFVDGIYDVADDPVSVADLSDSALSPADLDALSARMREKEMHHAQGCIGVLVDIARSGDATAPLYATCAALAHRSALLRSILLRTLAVQLRAERVDDKPQDSVPFDPIHALYNALHVDLSTLPSDGARRCFTSDGNVCDDCGCAALEATLGCGKLTDSERKVLLSSMSAACATDA